MDPLATETSEFWKNTASSTTSTRQIQTEVFRLPTTCFAEENGALVNSARWLQWHWKGAEPPGEARSDIEIMSELFLRMRKMYQKDGGKFPDPIANLAWPYANPEPDAGRTGDGIQRQGAGRPVRPKDPTKRSARPASSSPVSRSCATTAAACGCWIFSGAWTQAGNQMARRDNADPTGIGHTLNWAWAWPANRACCTTAPPATSGKPFDPKRKLIGWNGRHGAAPTCRTSRPTSRRRRDGPVHHEPGRRRALLRARGDGRRPVPRALRAVRHAARTRCTPTTRRR
jgi:formate dehydrogenase major subunit